MSLENIAKENVAYFTAAFEEHILGQMEQDEDKAKAELTKYCIENAEKAVDDYWQQGNKLWGKYTNYF